MFNQLAVNIGDQFFGKGGSKTGGSPLSSLTDVGRMVSFFLKTSFVITGIILIFYFLLGGIGLMSSAGQSDPQKAEQAKKTITSAIIGFIVVFAAYWIVKLIGKIFGFENII